MGRASGRRGPRDPVGEIIEDLKKIIGGDSDDGQTPGARREEGIGEPRDIPGGLNHMANPPVREQEVPVPAARWPYRRADLAHGVPPDEHGHHDRPDPRLSGGQRGQAPAAKAPGRLAPVPVYIVEGEGGPGVSRAAYPRSITCPASTTAEPARVCGRNENRVEIQLLNEDTATDIRFATNLVQLSAGSGALLPWPMNSYLTIKTQGELYAIGATGSGTPKLSIIEVFEQDENG
jgi:hypothetical protein